jgi:Flp pilus assembly pilin Flp
MVEYAIILVLVAVVVVIVLLTNGQTIYNVFSNVSCSFQESGPPNQHSNPHAAQCGGGGGG